MTIPPVSTSYLTPRSEPRPVLVVGPALGTSSAALWGSCAAELAGSFDLLGWDLPGHADSPPATEAFTLAELAAAVLAAVDQALAERGEPGAAVRYAGVSLGGAVVLQLLCDYPERVAAATLLATGSVIGSAASWVERAELVRGQGTGALRSTAPSRWFAAGFTDRDPATAAALLDALAATDDESYALACLALADFDVTDRLAEIGTAIVAVAGQDDVVTPPTALQAVADGVRHGRLVVLDDVAHLPPVEDSASVARIINADLVTHTETRIRGMAVRRAVLGDAHVDRATAQVTDLTRDFQQFITEYAWGSVWTRPELDRRTRSLMTITALIALGHHDELAMHIRAAKNNDVTDREIVECLLQSAIYCGVPAANAAFRIANQVLGDLPDPRGRP